MLPTNITFHYVLDVRWIAFDKIVNLRENVSHLKSCAKDLTLTLEQNLEAKYCCF